MDPKKIWLIAVLMYNVALYKTVLRRPCLRPATRPDHTLPSSRRTGNAAPACARFVRLRLALAPVSPVATRLRTQMGNWLIKPLPHRPEFVAEFLRVQAAVAAQEALQELDGDLQSLLQLRLQFVDLKIVCAKVGGRAAGLVATVLKFNWLALIAAELSCFHALAVLARQDTRHGRVSREGDEWLDANSSPDVHDEALHL